VFTVETNIEKVYLAVTEVFGMMKTAKHMTSDKLYANSVF